MRRLIALLFCASPATAWTFDATPLCTLSRTDMGAEMRITYDSGLGEYQLLLRDSAGPLPVPDIFSITFDGPRGLRITTDRHTLEDGALSVRDSGFGNVLNGLEFNGRAVAQVGTQSYAFDLSDAAPEVQKFRDCEVAPSV